MIVGFSAHMMGFVYSENGKNRFSITYPVTAENGSGESGVGSEVGSVPRD